MTEDTDAGDTSKLDNRDAVFRVVELLKVRPVYETQKAVSLARLHPRSQYKSLGRSVQVLRSSGHPI